LMVYFNNKGPKPNANKVSIRASFYGKFT